MNSPANCESTRCHGNTKVKGRHATYAPPTTGSARPYVKRGVSPRGDILRVALVGGELCTALHAVTAQFSVAIIIILDFSLCPIAIQ